MKAYHQISKKQIILFMCVCLLFSAWTFYLGIKVGRQAVVPELEPELNFSQAKAANLENMYKNQKDIDITSFEFYYKLKENSRSVTQNKNTHKKQRLIQQSDINAKNDIKKSDHFTKADIAFDNSNRDFTSRRFRIQVASFENKQHADLLLRKLREKGWSCFMENAHANNKSVWRIIIIGPFGNKAKAHQILKDIKKIEKTAFLVLR